MEWNGWVSTQINLYQGCLGGHDSRGPGRGCYVGLLHDCTKRRSCGLLLHSRCCAVSKSSETVPLLLSRSSVFIKFPGRDIGGIWAVFLPLSQEAWISTVAFILIVPFFLFISSRVLSHVYKNEQFTFGYGESLYLFFNAISQQVTQRPQSRRITSCFRDLSESRAFCPPVSSSC